MFWQDIHSLHFHRLFIKRFDGTTTHSNIIDISNNAIVEIINFIKLVIKIVVYAIAAGTEGGPKFVQMIRGNTAFAFGLLVLMLVFTVTLVPLILPLVIPHAVIHTRALVGKLLLVVALPIGLGLLLNHLYPAQAARISPFAHHLSMFLLYGLFVLLIYVNFQEILALQASALAAG